MTLVLIGVAVIAALVIGLATQTVPPAEYRRRLTQLENLWFDGQTLTITGNTTSTSPTIASPSTTAGIWPGMKISGAGIPSGTTIVAVSSASGGSITMSADATATATGVTLTTAAASPPAKIHLYAAPYTGGPNPTPSAFTEATFTGYTAIETSALVISPPYTTSTGGAEVDCGVAAWTLATTPTTSNEIYGYWVDYPLPTDTSTRVVAFYEPFATIIPMASPGDAVSVSVPFTDPNPGTVSQL